VSAHLQEREHERGELVTHGHAREPHARLLAWPAQGEGGLDLSVVAPDLEHHPRRESRDVVQQLEHLPRPVALVERGENFHRLLQPLQVSLQLRLEAVIEHDLFLVEFISSNSSHENSVREKQRPRL